MASEEWRIVLSSEEGAPGAGGAAKAAETQSQQKAAKAQEDMAKAQMEQKPVWQNLGKFLLPLAGIAGVVAFVFQMIRRSKIFSTFMDSFLTILSAFVDIMLIPIMPIFTWVLKFLVGLLPKIASFSEKVENFLKDPWSGLKSIFNWLIEIPAKIVKGIGSLFSGIGLGGIGDVFKGIGGHLMDAAKKLEPIFANTLDKIREIWARDDISFWEKIKLSALSVWEGIKESAKVVWEAIKTIWSEDIAPFIKRIWEEKIYPWLKSIWDSFVKKDLPPLWTSVTNWVKEEWKKIWPEIKNAGVDAFKGLLSLIPGWNEAQAKVQDLIHQLPTFMGVSYNEMNMTMSQLGQDLWGKVLEKAKEVWDWIKGEVGRFVTETLPGLFRSAIEGIMKGGFEAVTGKEDLPFPFNYVTPWKSEESALQSWRPELPFWLGGGGQIGINYVPREALYHLHKGERVVPAAENRNYDQRRSSNVTINIGSSVDPFLPWRISKSVEEKVKFSMYRIV